jgi:hypothetical protein
MVIGTTIVRAGLMFALVRYVHGPILFPLAFSMLVMGKTQAIAKSALVPAMVPNHEALVRSNARLSVLAGLASAAAGVPGIVLLQLGGAPLVLSFGSVLFVLAAILAFRIPSVKVASRPAEAEEKAELRSAGIVLASTAMGYLRGIAGFVTLLLAFELRGGIDPGPTDAGVQIGHRLRESMGLERLDLASGGAPPWHFGVALVGVGIGGLLAALMVPRLRSVFREERILALSLFVLAGLCALASLATGVVGAFLAGVAVSLAGTGGKQSFDAIVQRDAPKANLGRFFGRFESRFQLLWVVGALIPVIVPVPARAGYLAVVVSGLFIGVTYWFGVKPDPRALLTDARVAERLPIGFRQPLAAPFARFRAGAGRRQGAGDDGATPEHVGAATGSSPDEDRAEPPVTAEGGDEADPGSAAPLVSAEGGDEADRGSAAPLVSAEGGEHGEEGCAGEDVDQGDQDRTGKLPLRGELTPLDGDR